nr:hypothetical protein [uncultured Oscillibacter sp.]
MGFCKIQPILANAAGKINTQGGRGWKNTGEKAGKFLGSFAIFDKGKQKNTVKTAKNLDEQTKRSRLFRQEYP